MSSFEVKTQVLVKSSEELKGISDRVQDIADEARNTINKTRSSISSRLAQSGKSSVIHASISLCSSDMTKLSQILKKASDTYNVYEEKIKSDEHSFAVSAATAAAAAAVTAAGANSSQVETEDGAVSSGLKGSVVYGEKSGKGEFLGLDTSGKASGSLLGYDVDGKTSATWDTQEGEIKIGAEGNATAYAAKGELEGSIGALKGTAEGAALVAGTSGSIGLSIMKDNKFSPSLEADVKAKANVVEGEAGVQLGSDENNAHAKAKGSALGAEASASAGVGVIEVKDKETGKVSTQLGVEGSVGAEAYLAKGEVSGGLSILGIDFDVSVSGKAGAVGVSAGGSITTGGVSGKIGGALGLGAGLEVSVDWSDFKMPEINWPFW